MTNSIIDSWLISVTGLLNGPSRTAPHEQVPDSDQFAFCR